MEEKAGGMMWDQVFGELPEEVFLIPAYVSAIGSSVDDAEPGDIDVLIRGEPRDFDAEVQVYKALERAGVELPVEFVYNPTGPHGQSIPLYDLKLVRRPGVETVGPGSEKAKAKEGGMFLEEKGERIVESAQSLFLTLFDDVLLGEEEGTMVNFISESELAARLAAGRELMDSLLGTDSVEVLEAEGKAKPVAEDRRVEEGETLLDDLLEGGDRVTKAREQVEEGEHVVQVPIFEHSRLHGTGIKGYREVKVKAETDPLTEEEREKLQAYEELLDILSGGA